MVGIIVSGHGKFASGITAALNLIMGDQEHYCAVDFPEGDTKTEIENNIKFAIDSFKDLENILIFTDLLSGSPFNVSIMEAIKDERIRVIYGTNLGMLIETVMKRNMGVPFENLVEEAVTTGKEVIGVFKVEDNDDEDDF